MDLSVSSYSEACQFLLFVSVSSLADRLIQVGAHFRQSAYCLRTDSLCRFPERSDVMTSSDEILCSA